METKKPDKSAAIISLVGGAIGWSSDSDEIKYLDGQTPPSEAEIDAELKRLQAEYDAQEYARNRKEEYPSLQEQMDMQYWDEINGTTTWKDAIAKVKSDNPKG